MVWYLGGILSWTVHFVSTSIYCFGTGFEMRTEELQVLYFLPDIGVSLPQSTVVP